MFEMSARDLSGRNLLAGAALLLIVLLAGWGYLRATAGGVAGAIEGIRRLQPHADERQRLLQDLANEHAGSSASDAQRLPR
jgi:hypothetical protein